MKKLNLAIALAIGLTIPFAVMPSADNEIHKHAMEMHENTTESVMKRVELPDAAANKVTDEATVKNRLIKKSAGNVTSKGKFYSGDEVPANKYKNDEGINDESVEGSGKLLQKKSAGTSEAHTGQGTGESVGDLDRDRIQDQDKEQIHDMDQDRVMDQDQDRAMEMDQDQLRDNDHEFEKNPSMVQDVEQDPPMVQEMDQQQNQIDTELTETESSEASQSTGVQTDDGQSDAGQSDGGSQDSGSSSADSGK